jgi:hypothetical protein
MRRALVLYALTAHAWVGVRNMPPRGTRRTTPRSSG